jgi:hypothetical protein
MRRHRLLFHAGLLAALGLGLGVSSVALADQGQCEANCATSASGEMSTCLERCPEGRDPTKASSFQACALRCKGKFDASMSACTEHCPGNKNKDASGKKKKHGSE